MVIACSLGLSLLSCGTESSPRAAAVDGPKQLEIAVTLAPQAWLVEQIAGERARILTLVTAGESPATFQPSDAQVSRLMGSDVYFRIGVPCERGPWFGAVEGARRVEIIDQRQGVEPLFLPGHGDHGTDQGHRDRDGPEHRNRPENKAGADPHIWLSPRRLRQQARTLAETLERLDPGHGDVYRLRWRELDQRLETLDADLRRRLLPFAGRTFLAFHPSWGYLAHDYGLRQVALEIEGKEASEAEVSELRRLAQEENLQIVFVQPQISGRSARAVAEALGGRTEILDPLARDIDANLRHAADRLVASFR